MVWLSGLCALVRPPDPSKLGDYYARHAEESSVRSQPP